MTEDISEKKTNLYDVCNWQKKTNKNIYDIIALICTIITLMVTPSKINIFFSLDACTCVCVFFKINQYMFFFLSRDFIYNLYFFLTGQILSPSGPMPSGRINTPKIFFLSSLLSHFKKKSEKKKKKNKWTKAWRILARFATRDCCIRWHCRVGIIFVTCV